jgi:hypothetical protein
MLKMSAMCVNCMHEPIFILSCEVVRDIQCDPYVDSRAPSDELKVQGSSDPNLLLNNNFTSSLEMFEGVEIDGALINW